MSKSAEPTTLTLKNDQIKIIEIYDTIVNYQNDTIINTIYDTINVVKEDTIIVFDTVEYIVENTSTGIGILSSMYI